MPAYESVTVPPGPPQYRGEDGLYYSDDASRRIPDISQASWNVYFEDWVSNAWVTPFESLESAVRLGDKLREETAECLDAYAKYETAPTAEKRQQFLEEAGDVLWVSYASSCNLGGVHYAELELMDQLRPLLFIPDPQPGLYESFPRYDNLGALWQAGYRVSPAALVEQYSFFAPEAVLAVPRDGKDRMRTDAEVVARAAEYIWRRAKDTISRDMLHRFSMVFVTPVVTDILLEVGALVRTAGASHEDVLEILIPKIEARIAAGTVDKSSADRE